VARPAPRPDLSVSQRTELVDAWNLTPGDELPGGVLVVSIHREVRTRAVRVLTDEPASSELPGNSPVAVVRRFL
jgi:hypothetical protein